MNRFLRFSNVFLKFVGVCVVVSGAVFSSEVQGQTVIFSENIGTGTVTQSIAATTFQNPGLNFTGTADTRTSTASIGYAGASGEKNVFITNTVGTFFQISGIDASNFTSLKLSFGAHKSTTTSNLTELVVEYSVNGSSYIPLTFPAQPIGSGTASWRLISNISLPVGADNASNLRLRWTQTSSGHQFRIDDIKLEGVENTAPNPEPTNHPTAFACGTSTSSSIQLNWTDATGTNLPSGYLIRYSTVGFASIPNPVDGTPVADGPNAFNVSHGSQTVTIPALNQDTEYFFKIFAYANSGSNIDYKTDGTPLQIACFTQEGFCEEENFDGITLGGSYTNFSFSKNGGTVEYSCLNCLKQIIANQNGSPATNNSSPAAIRLEDATGSQFQVKLTQGGIGTFSMYVRRWDNSPDPNYIVEYTINNGNSWTTVQTLSNIWFGTSAYKQLSFDLNATSEPANNGDDIIVRISRISGERIIIDDVSWSCYDGCTATQTISAFTPNSGPQGTVVTINGSGFTGATGVKFGGITTSTFSVVDDNIITAMVGASSISGRLSVTVAGCDRVSEENFSVLLQNGNCGGEGGGSGATDLFISNVYDAPTGSLSYVEIFNGTLASVTLSPYTIRIRTGISEDNDYPMSGNLPSGGTYILRLGSSSSGTCTGFTIANNLPTASGFNGNDQIFLRKSGADLDYAPNPNSTFAGGNGANAPGFSQTRKNTVTSPTTVYNANEWIISDQENCSNLGVAPYNPVGAFITINNHPASVYCESIVTFSVNATSPAGFAGGTSGFIWRFHIPGTTGWLPISDLSSPDLSVAGASTNTITITGNTALIKEYQFYVDMGTVGTPQCRRYSNVAQYDYDSRPFYRSQSAGNWTNPDSWEMSDTEVGGYINVCQPPTAFNSDKIIIEHNVILDFDVSASWVVITDGYQLEIGNTSQLTIENGNPSGADLEIAGTLVDNGTTGNGITFVSGGTWNLFSEATLVKTNTSSVVQYRDNYEGGISTIPADANWIYRRVAFNEINMATIDMTYPNLIFENVINGDIYAPTNTNYTFSGNSTSSTVKGNLNIGGSGLGNMYVRNNNFNVSPILVQGNLIIRTGSRLLNEHTGTEHGTGFEVRGNLEINGLLDLSSGGTGRGLLRLSGPDETIATGSSTVYVNDLDIAKTGSATTTFDAIVNVSRQTFLNNGILIFIESGFLDLNPTASIGAGSLNSFVAGTIRKNFAGTTEFFFPVGDVSLNNADPEDDYIVFQRASLTPQTGAAVAFTVRYFHENYNEVFPDPYNPPMVGLSSVSTCNYWLINRTSGSTPARVGLSWNEANCFDVTDPDALKVARKSIDDWEPASVEIDNVTHSGDPYATGFIKSGGYVVNFSPFAIGQIGSDLNILPISLLSFTAEATADNLVETHWATASETNNDFFTVERSVNAMDFSSVGTVAGAGNSTSKLHYGFADDGPYAGISYYRLRQTDYDGTFTFSDIVAVQIGEAPGFDIDYVYHSDLGVELGYHAISPYLTVEIYDLTGRRLFGDILENVEGRSVIYPSLARGVYLLRLSQGREQVVKKFFY